MNNLTIINTQIRQDAEGRYCLNDVHKASGTSRNKRTSNWLRTEQAKELLEQIKGGSNMSHPLSVVKSSAGQGTFACKELVYAYAMWISPKFHLAVIRAFDDLVTGKISSPSLEARVSALENGQIAIMNALTGLTSAVERLTEKMGNHLSHDFEEIPKISKKNLKGIKIAHPLERVFRTDNDFRGVREWCRAYGLKNQDECLVGTIKKALLKEARETGIPVKYGPINNEILFPHLLACYFMEREGKYLIRESVLRRSNDDKYFRKNMTFPK